MAERHPDLVKALAAAKRGDVGPVLGVAARAILAQDEGRYCECADPVLAGDDLLCGACLLNNKDQERRRCAVICDAHDFVPGPCGGLMCKVCMCSESAPRHHGVDATPRYSWES